MKLVPCANCGQSINAKRDVCPFCNAAVVKSVPPPPAAPPPPATPVGTVAAKVAAPAAPAARRPLWKRPNFIIPLFVGIGALVALLLAIGLPLVHSTLTPQQIYEQHADSVVEIRARFPATYDLYGQQTGGGEGLGTGFVVSRDGYILTNAHVVSDDGQVVGTVSVVFKGDGSQSTPVAGTVVGADESNDVALIKVDPSRAPKLEPIPLGDSSKTSVGEEVVAIGNPHGLDFSLSRGVVSATGRELESPNGTTIFDGIQTDAAINPGSSGGPLIDTTGRVIGINFQIASEGGGNEGIGFAVPINTAVRVMEQLKAGAPAQ